MEPVANRPWDAWHVVNDGKRFIINYVSDGFYYCCLLFNAFTQQAYMPNVGGHQL
jgi:hypothetical protein